MEIKLKILEILNNERIFDRLAYLHGRWLDEKQYEDFDEYTANLRKLLEAEVPIGKVVKVTKRPFGFKMVIDGIKIHFHLKVKGESCRFRAVVTK